PQQLARVLVGAVLGPQQREHRQLDVVGLAPVQLDDALVLGVGETELAVFRLGHAHAAAVAPAAASNSFRPSLEPVSSSTACSGCGLSPSTLPAPFAPRAEWR